MQKRWLLIISISILPVLTLGQSSEAVFSRAETLFNNGNYQEAARLYTEVISIEPTNMNAYLRRGFCYSVQKEFEKSIADYGMIIEHHPEHVFAYISRGSAYNKLERFNAAVMDFDKALDLDPENQDAYNNRGWAKHGLDLHDEACSDWKRSKKLGNKEAKLILKNNHCK